MARIGYARVSTADQNLDSQIDELKRAECERIFKDVASGAKADRPGLTAALAYLRAGDTLVVWKLDRLGRSLLHLIATIETLHERGIAFVSLSNEGFDTNSAAGRLFFSIFAALAEFERELIRERTRAGLAAATARGRKGGRRPVISAEKLRRAQELTDSGLNVREAAARLKVSKTALYAARAKAKASPPAKEPGSSP